MATDNLVEEARHLLNHPGWREPFGSDARRIVMALCNEVERLHHLIVHMHVHSGYRNNGYMQMTTEQKALYDAIWNRSVEELDREEERSTDGE